MLVEPYYASCTLLPLMYSWWDDAAKLKWLRVRLTGRAGTVFRRLPEATRGDFKEAKKALKKRFEPDSKK